MKERPILFSAPMVCALLDGTKTQTRRIVKPQPDPSIENVEFYAADELVEMSTSCPYGEVGDRLWVRESHYLRKGVNKLPAIAYAAENAAADGVPEGWSTKRPSIHMPRWASRITLEITGVKVERLQDISEEDAKAEGIKQCEGGAFDYCANDYAQGFSPRSSFLTLWNSINGKPYIETDDDGLEICRQDFSWAANPWVWVISFKRVAS